MDGKQPPGGINFAAAAGASQPERGPPASSAIVPGVAGLGRLPVAPVLLPGVSGVGSLGSIPQVQLKGTVNPLPGLPAGGVSGGPVAPHAKPTVTPPILVISM